MVFVTVTNEIFRSHIRGSRMIMCLMSKQRYSILIHIDQMYATFSCNADELKIPMVGGFHLHSPFVKAKIQTMALNGTCRLSSNQTIFSSLSCCTFYHGRHSFHFSRLETNSSPKTCAKFSSLNSPYCFAIVR